MELNLKLRRILEEVSVQERSQNVKENTHRISGGI